MSAREFKLGQVLSVTHDRLLCPIADLYEILNFLTGDNLFTHQLPRAMRECRPSILSAHPRLSEVDVTSVTPENWKDWLAEQVVEFGPLVSLLPLKDGEHEFIDPLSELAEKVHPDRIVVVKTNGGAS